MELHGIGLRFLYPTDTIDEHFAMIRVVFETRMHLIILVKYLIFTSRERKTPPTFTEIKNKLKEDRVEEMKLASVRNSMGIHVSKWENLAID